MSINSGYVYFIYYEEIKNKFKIGMSRNLKVRIDELNRGCPYEIKVYKYLNCSNYREVEKWAHKHFEDYLIGHEWFEINKKQIDEFLSTLKYKKKEL